METVVLVLFFALAGQEPSIRVESMTGMEQCRAVAENLSVSMNEAVKDKTVQGFVLSCTAVHKTGVGA